MEEINIKHQKYFMDWESYMRDQLWLKYAEQLYYLTAGSTDKQAIKTAHIYLTRKYEEYRIFEKYK